MLMKSQFKKISLSILPGRFRTYSSNNQPTDRRMSSLEIQHLKRKGFHFSFNNVFKSEVIPTTIRKKNRYDNSL